MTKDVKGNLVTYFVFLLITIAGLYFGKSIAEDHVFLRIWSFSNVLLLLIGVPFLFFQNKAGLPDFWQTLVSNKNRFIIPLFIGILFGILDIIVFKIILHPQPYQELPPFVQPFPYSLFLYFSGAFEVEVFYRLIPLTLILLIGKWVSKGAYYEMFFRAGIILTALREPLEQLPEGNFLLILYSFIAGFLMNLIQAIWYRKAGLLASLSVRLGHYLLWHILLGLYIQFFETV